jgi:hypothetical protein
MRRHKVLAFASIWESWLSLRVRDMSVSLRRYVLNVSDDALDLTCCQIPSLCSYDFALIVFERSVLAAFGGDLL